MRRGALERARDRDPQIGVHVEQLARPERPPARIFVHRLARHDHGSSRGELARAHAHRAARAGMVQVPPAGRTARAAFEHVKLVHVGVAQRPQLGGGGEDQCEGDKPSQPFEISATRDIADGFR